MVTLGKSREILEKTSREISKATPTKFLRSNSEKSLDNPLRCPQRNYGRNSERYSGTTSGRNSVEVPVKLLENFFKRNSGKDIRKPDEHQ